MKFNRCPFFTLLFSVVALISAAPGSGSAEEPSIRFSFDEPVDLLTFIKTFEKLTGESFILDPNISGKIVAAFDEPLSDSEAFQVLLMVLETNGYTAIRRGGALKIIPLKNARQEGGPVIFGQDVGDLRSGLLTVIIPVHHVSADQLKSICFPLLSDTGALSVHEPSNSLVITDREPNIRRLTELLRGLDRSSEEEIIRSYPLVYSQADQIAVHLTDYFNNSNQSVRPRVTMNIIADRRANRIVAGGPQAGHDRLTALLAELDTPAPPEQSEAHVVYLTYADAQQLVSVLNAQAGQEQSGESGVRITADKATNSLVIQAKPERFASLQTVIQQLDRPQAQVFVEALIMEVSLGRMKGLGLEWRMMDQPAPGSVRGAGGTNFPMDGESGALNQYARAPFDGPAGLALGAVNGTITFGGVEFANIGALLHAVQDDNQVEILSTPRISAMDHEEAVIIVGEERPFLKSSQVTDVGAVVKTYEFKDIGITLRLTPHVVRENAVKLHIFQEIRSFLSESDVGAVTTTLRQAETTVLAQDGQPVIIGGLIRDDQTRTTGQVPCLGSVPLLGWAFKGLRHRSNKTNLLIVLTPHILKTPSEMAEFSNSQMSNQPAAPVPNKPLEDITDTMRLMTP